MDRLIYTAMAGAKMLTQRHETVAHNLANVSTNGFKAELTAFRAVPVLGPGAATRVSSVETTTGANFAQGPVIKTGNALDVAIDGRGFFTVQQPDGTEAYTRDGAFTLNADGQVITRAGLPVMGQSGPIVIPPNYEIVFGRDGTVAAIPRGQGTAQPLTIDRLRTVRPDDGSLERGGNGLFRVKGDGEVPYDPTVVVSPSSLEGSNVSAVESLVNLIEISRHFETQMKLIQTADQNSRTADQLLSMSS